MTALADEKYVSVSTFRKSGVPVATPTWVVALDDGRLGIWTSSSTGKAKRLRNDPRILLQPSDARGRVKQGTAVTEGQAQLVTTGPDFEAIQAEVKAKYGVMVPITRALNALGHIGKGTYPYGNLGIVITVTDSPPGN